MAAMGPRLLLDQGVRRDSDKPVLLYALIPTIVSRHNAYAFVQQENGQEVGQPPQAPQKPSGGSEMADLPPVCAPAVRQRKRRGASCWSESVQSSAQACRCRACPPWPSSSRGAHCATKMYVVLYVPPETQL